MGEFSREPAAERRRSGRLSVARGYSRCSGKTPTAWVGTRAKRRGCAGTRSGFSRNAGARGVSGPKLGRSLPAQTSAESSSGQFSNGSARFDAFNVPSETPVHCRWQWPNKLNFQTVFLELPRPHPRGAERYDVTRRTLRQPVENVRSVLT